MGSAGKQKAPTRWPSSSAGDGSCSEAGAAHLPDDSEHLLPSGVAGLDGGVEDEALQGSDALTREEVVRRRARRVRQLMKLYRAQYWSLMEELRAKYRIFYLRHGRSGYRDEAEMEEKESLASIDGPNKHSSSIRSTVKEPLAIDPSSSSSSIETKCSFQGCKSKPMALTTFCFTHILSDPIQELYKPCEYATRSGQSGPVTCSKPVLRAVKPCFCPVHFQQAQKQTVRSVRKGPLDVATATKPTLKLHLVIAEYVRLIQRRRRAVSESVLKLVTRTSGNEAVNASGAPLLQEQVPQITPQT